MLTTSQPDPTTRTRLSPLALWRWGFSLLLIGVGTWLVFSDLQIGGASGRTLGWIVILYAVVRLTISWFLQRASRRF